MQKKKGGKKVYTTSLMCWIYEAIFAHKIHASHLAEFFFPAASFSINPSNKNRAIKTAAEAERKGKETGRWGGIAWTLWEVAKRVHGW